MSEPMTLQVRVAAPIDAVHHALTDAGVIQIWLAEHAEVDLPQRQYAFWGRYTPEGDAPHQRLLHVDDRTLRFAWLLDGEDTTAEFRLAEDGADATLITLTQTHFDFEDVVTGASIRGVLQAFWTLSTANLVDYLEGREVTARCDFTSPELQMQVLIGAERPAVYDSLVDSEKVTAWFGYPIGIEPWVGGRFALGGLDVDGPPATIVDLVPDRKLAIDWGDWGITTWELEDSGGKTRLTFVQSGFRTQQLPYSGWIGTVAGIAELRRYHELANWSPIRVPVAQLSVG